MLQKIRHLFSEYLELGLVIIATVIALGLQIAGLNTATHVILGVTASIAVVPIILDIIQQLRDGRYGVDILAATAIIAAVIFREYWAAIVIVLMYTGGEALEDYAENRAKTELTALMDRVPTTAHVVRGRKTVDIRVSDVKVNDRLTIMPGELVPVDGIVLEGSGAFDESSLTGESLPIDKTVGEELLSGSVSVDGLVTIKVLRSANDSQYEQIIKLVRSAASSQAPFVRLADRYSIPFTIVAFAIAIGAWVISGESIRFLEVLVVATPCPLILGAPVALISGMSRSAKHGIIVKNGSALERLARVRTIGFDKTGTLTQGRPVVGNVQSFGTYKSHDVLKAAASLEQNSNHVLATAIVQAAAQRAIKPAKVKKLQEVAGRGLKATVSGKQVLVGNLRFMEDESIPLPKRFDASSRNQTMSLVAINGQMAGAISFTDELRPESKATLKKLRQLGIKHFLMVTGDSSATARQVARQLGIKEVYAEALPADKLKAIASITNRPVAFVGDGVNDAPVLTAADVGVALGARGSTAASESADVVILLDDIGRVPVAIDIAKNTFRIARQTILSGIGLSIILMFIFATGRFRPVYGALAQELIDVLVIINALRAHGSWARTKTPTISQVSEA